MRCHVSLSMLAPRLSCAPLLSPWNSPTASWRKPASCPQLLHRLVPLTVTQACKAQSAHGAGHRQHGRCRYSVGGCSRDGGTQCVLNSAKAAPMAAQQKPLLALYVPIRQLCTFAFVDLFFPHRTPVPMAWQRECLSALAPIPGASGGAAGIPRSSRPLCPAPPAASPAALKATVRGQRPSPRYRGENSARCPLIFFSSPPDGSQDPSLIPGFPCGFCSVLFWSHSETLVRSCRLFSHSGCPFFPL